MSKFPNNLAKIIRQFKINLILDLTVGMGKFAMEQTAKLRAVFDKFCVVTRVKRLMEVTSLIKLIKNEELR